MTSPLAADRPSRGTRILAEVSKSGVALFSGVALLAAAHAALDLVACHFGSPLSLQPNPDLIAITLLGIALGQATLLALFLSLAPAPFWRRLAGVVAGGAFMAKVFGGALCSPFWEVGLVVFTGAPFGAVAIVGCLARLRGLQCRRLCSHEPPGSQALRFTLRDIFAVTTAAGVFLGALRLLRELLGEPSLVVLFLGLLPLAAGTLIQPALALWATLTPGPPLRRCAAIVPITFICGVAPPFVGKATIGVYYTVLAPLAIQAVLLLGSLLTVRTLGFRTELDVTRSFYARPGGGVFVFSGR